MNGTKVLIHANVFDSDGFRENQFVRFADTVRETGPMAAWSPKPGEEVLEAADAWVLPGFVAGHTHVYSLFARGLSLPFSPKSFRDILSQLWWKLDAGMDNAMTRAAAAAAAGEFLQNGVTTILDHHASGGQISGSLLALKEGICGEGGMRGVFCFETSDRYDPSACIEENRSFLSRPADGFSAGMFGLHASMTLSEETLRKVKASLGTAPIHVHVAEGPEDEEDCLTRYGERVIARLNRHGLLNPGSLVVHAIRCEDSELAILKARRCRIALNVSSNMNNGVGLPDIGRILRARVPVIVGNDGLSSGIAGEWQNVYFAAHLQKGIVSFSLSDLQRMIEESWAFAGAHLGVKLGKIRPGWQADLLVVPYLPPTPLGAENAFSHLFFGLLPGFRPKDVFVAGRPRVRDYRLDPGLAKAGKTAVREAQRLQDALKEER